MILRTNRFFIYQTVALLALFSFNCQTKATNVVTDQSIQENLGKFFNQLGAKTNTTGGGSYQDQTAGHYTGGSLFARNTVHNSQLAHIQLPGYRAGCGGIDMHFGALSHISGQQIVQALRAIGSSMASYGLMLAIETMSPQVKNIMTELNDLAQKVNMANINSCKVAATALGSLLPRSDAANHHLCTMIGSDRAYGDFSDYAAASQGCGSGGQRQAILAQGKSDARFAKMLGSEFNLAWQAIQENAFLRANKDLAEFFMSVSGTILSVATNDTYQVSSKPSLADRHQLLTTLLHGGTVNIYSCDHKEKCLSVTEKSLTIAPNKALVAQARAMLLGIQTKIYEDVALTPAEIDFLNTTRLPFYKILNVATAYRRGAAPIEIEKYAELAAVDMLFQYLTEIITVVEESAAHLKSAQVEDGQIQRFEEGLRMAKGRVYQRRMGSFKDIEPVIAMIQQTELLEKTLTAKLGVIGAEGL